MRELDDKTNVREGVIILRRSDNTTRDICWVSPLARRVVRSTSTGEVLAAADGADLLPYLSRVLAELGIKHSTELVLDARSTFHLCPTVKKLTETKNEILLAGIREEHNSGALKSIRWTSGQSHLADALMKRNPVVAMKLDEVLKNGFHEHPPASYSVAIDMNSSPSDECANYNPEFPGIDDCGLTSTA